MKKLNITIWNEYRCEKTNDAVKKIYPNGIHNAIADHFKTIEEFNVRTATLDESEHGLTDEVINTTDVMFWWGHKAHDEVRDDIVEKVHERVQAGMGLVVLHSGHLAKIFLKLMGTLARSRWRDCREKERLWVIEPGHPIVDGIGPYIELPQEEMYGERFNIPAPDELVFISWFEGGNVFRSGCCYKRGHGKIFYFRPGHEEFPVYYNPEILKVMSNAAKWARPTDGPANSFGEKKESLEEIKKI